MRHRCLRLHALLLVAAWSLGCGAKSQMAGYLDGDGDVVDSALDDAIGVDVPIPDVSFDVCCLDDIGIPPGPLDIALEPPHAIVFIDTATSPVTPAIVDYKATLTLTDGSKKDVTSEIALSLGDLGLGTFAGPRFTSVTKLPGPALGVTTLVRGTAEGRLGIADLTIVQLRRTGEKRDFFFIVPYLGAPSPTRDVLKFGTSIKQVDVAFSVDTTGSMGSSIANLKSTLSASIVPGLAKAIPSVGIAVAYHDDYPVAGHGNAPCNPGDRLPGDVPEGTIQIVTTDIAKAQSAMNQLETHCGGDEPEAQIPSMFQVVTGKGLKWPTGLVPPHTPAPGTFGGVDFRPGSLPVVLEITDAHWHDPTFEPYLDLPDAPQLVRDLEPAMKAQNARFVGVFDVHYIDYEDQENLLSDATNSNVPPAAFAGKCGAGQCCTLTSGGGRAPTGPGGSCRLNFQIRDGAGLGDSIVQAIQAISVGTIFDVTAVKSNDPGNPDGVDATKFIKALRAMDEGDGPSGCAPHPAKDTDGDGVKDTFSSVIVGTPVCFEILPQENTTVKPRARAQFFNAFIDVLGMPGAVKLDRRTVVFMVPAVGVGAK